ncbi:MAG TPA: LCP family protein, partial [Acidimicrobiales bacterium]
PRRRWPASKRARAAARRRTRAQARAAGGGSGTGAAGGAGSGTADAGAGAAGDGSPRGAGATGGGATQRRARVRPAAPERLRRQRARIVAGLAAAAVAGAALALLGLTVVRNSTAGRYVDPPLQPDEPGYQAYVVSTPTLAVLHRTPSGALAGAAVLSLEPNDDGGAVIVVPPSTRMPAAESDEGDGGLTVAAAYDGGGADAVAGSLSDILGAAIDDAVVVDDARWEALVDPVAPITVTLEERVGDWPAGDVQLEAAEVGDFLRARGPGETELERVARQARFWAAWLERVGSGGRAAVPGEIDSGLGRFVRGVARRPTPAILPVTPVGAAGTTFRPDDDRIAELVADAVPYPLSPAPGRRVRVRLLNGTSDPDLTPAAARQLVEAGAEITIAGNAESFDVDETTLSYRSPDERDDARRLADAFGVGQVQRVDDEPAATADARADEIDVTIVLGSDAQDLLGRLEDPG